MKKIILAALCALCTMTATAQRISSFSSLFSTEKSTEPITLGIRAGMNCSSFGGYAGNWYQS